MNNCKICGQSFESEKKLHMHLRSHKITLAEYYTKYFPRNNLLTGDPLPFKNKDQYFEKDFSNRKQLLQWCKESKGEKVKSYILKALKQRIQNKKLNFAPSHIELSVSELPTIDLYKEYFGSYSEACKMCGVKPLFGSELPKDWNQEIDEDIKIFIDTRERQPLTFKNSESLKLDFGDYAVGQKYYAYTYVDRKSETDFKSTLSKNNLERFEAELQRAKDFDSYLFIVTETDMSTMEKRNRWSPHTSNMKYIYHNMRVLAHKFAGNCQFIFTGSRSQSQKLIPKLLTMGKSLWDVDLQYYINKKII
tara:strand:+ start:108 stop:1025 length:918 start_codon:yes stop_codon:yes gene_type:complete